MEEHWSDGGALVWWRSTGLMLDSVVFKGWPAFLFCLETGGCGGMCYPFPLNCCHGVLVLWSIPCCGTPSVAMGHTLCYYGSHPLLLWVTLSVTMGHTLCCYGSHSLLLLVTPSAVAPSRTNEFRVWAGSLTLCTGLAEASMLIWASFIANPVCVCVFVCCFNFVLDVRIL